MNNIKTGVSMGGIIISTRSKEHYEIMKKKDKQKVNRAKVCIDCESNHNSYCAKYEEPCFKTNYICSGVKNPYVYKPSGKRKSKSKSKVKIAKNKR